LPTLAELDILKYANKKCLLMRTSADAIGFSWSVF
jgi:hypothetical protein